MFVATHKGVKTHVGDVRLLGTHANECHCVDHRGSAVCIISAVEFDCSFKPIIIPCPYCTVKLHQDKYVECGRCGMVIRAIDEEIMNAFEELRITRIKKGDSSTVYSNNIGDGVVIRRIKSIHWLEIKKGVR